MTLKDLRNDRATETDSARRGRAHGDGVDVSLSARSCAGEPFKQIMDRRLARRSFLKGAAATPVVMAIPTALLPRDAEAENRDDYLKFKPIAPTTADDVVTPDGYTAHLIIRWGDSLFADTEDLDTSNLIDGALLDEGAADKQAKQFGYNCDLNAYFPLAQGAQGGRNGVIAVNHEYVNPPLMFPNYPEEFGPEGPILDFVRTNPEAVRVLKAAHGLTLVEIKKHGHSWGYVKGSPYNVRITADTEMELTGPARGHALFKTDDDPEGARVHGTLNNCAGGKTPWGTVLSCEENIDRYFGRAADLVAAATGDAAAAKIVRRHERVAPSEGMSDWAWEEVDERFNVSLHPNEAFRFGWVVEIDPYDPGSTPKKRTALGRFKHEGATTTIAQNGQVVVYSGDDARFEYVYKFVSDGKYNPNDRKANMAILDAGKLYVAKFNDDGTGRWLPLELRANPALGDEFADQGELLIDARRAGDIAGATPMDRPEDIEVNQKTGKIYVALTNNTRRTNDPAGTRDAQGRAVPTFPNGANPRSPNPSGHVIEITEAGEQTANTFHWEIFMLCGDPRSDSGSYLTTMEDLDDLPLASTDTYFAGWSDAASVSPIGAPDNLAFAADGTLWVATDGAMRTTGYHDGFFVVPVEGGTRGHLRQFLSVPTDAEACGPELTPDGKTIFCNVQHPGDSGSISGTKGGTPPLPGSDWPDRNGLPPRPSLVAVTKNDGGKIGS